MRIVVLGTGTPEPNPRRGGASVLVDIGDAVLMFDCGPGATATAVGVGYPPRSIDFVLLTHHHFDHTLDLSQLALARWDRGPEDLKALQVFGPRGTEHLVDALFGEGGAYETDQIARTRSIRSLYLHSERGGRVPRERARVIPHDIRDGVVCSGKDWKVTAGIATHVEWLDSLAYRVDTEEESVVVAGDTIACRSLIDLAQGADTLVWSCVNNGSTVIAGPSDAAQLASRAGVRRLVLHHFEDSMTSPERVDEIREVVTRGFDGELVLAMEDPCEV